LFAAQRRRGEFGRLAQDDNLLGFSELSWFLKVDTGSYRDRMESSGPKGWKTWDRYSPA
jgi:hypothetical protein